MALPPRRRLEGHAALAEKMGGGSLKDVREK
jgi:hypothetical protein